MPYDQVMHKFASGRLRSSSGQKVTDHKQAVAIMLSEKRAAEHGKKEYQPSNGHPFMKLAAKQRKR